MSNSTTSPVPLSGFNLLYKNWSVSQHEIYSVMDISASSALKAFVTVLTQYVISQWIWSSFSKNNLEILHIHDFISNNIIEFYDVIMMMLS